MRPVTRPQRLALAARRRRHRRRRLRVGLRHARRRARPTSAPFQATPPEVTTAPAGASVKLGQAGLGQGPGRPRRPDPLRLHQRHRGQEHLLRRLRPGLAAGGRRPELVGRARTRHRHLRHHGP